VAEKLYAGSRGRPAENFALLGHETLGTIVGLSPGDIVLDGDPAPPKRGHRPNFQPLSIVAQRLDASGYHLARSHLSYCWALVFATRLLETFYFQLLFPLSTPYFFLGIFSLCEVHVRSPQVLCLWPYGNL